MLGKFVHSLHQMVLFRSRPVVSFRVWKMRGVVVSVIFEDKGIASPLTEQQFQGICQKTSLPEVVVLSAASAKEVAGTFIRAGISNVVAVETSDDERDIMLQFIRKFYFDLARGRTLRDSFEAGLQELPERRRNRCMLLSEAGYDSVSLFDDAGCGPFRDFTPRLPWTNCRPGSHLFLGRETQVQEVYMHLVEDTKVTTIKGCAGIGKTEVALQACSYARERRVFDKMFFVSLQDEKGVPITKKSDVEARIIAAFGISPQDVARSYSDGFLGCIQEMCRNSDEHYLLVLDGCAPCFVDDRGKREKLSKFMDRLRQRVSTLKYIITVVNQVGIPKEKVVPISYLTNLAAAELFVASAPREVTVQELRGGIVISGPQIRNAECMRTFAGSEIMAALGGHPGAIVSTSAKLGKRSVGRDLLRNDDEFVYDIIPKQLARYKKLDAEFMRQLEECLQEQNGGVLPGPTMQRNRDERHVPNRVETRRDPRGRSACDGESLWVLAMEKYAGRCASLCTIPWKELYKNSLAHYFVDVLGDAGDYRPLEDGDFDSLGANEDIWHPYTPPGRRTNLSVDKVPFLGKFWPWFNAATYLLKDTGYWGNRRYPVICNLQTITSEAGAALLQGKPKGTFLIRVSTTQTGTLVIMYVSRPGEVLNVRIQIDSEGKFAATVWLKRIRAHLRPLILRIDELTHLFPDTPKHIALSTHV